MTPYYSDDLVTIYHGDCLEVMAGMEPESVDAIVTDPPYGLEFMGKEWDRIGRPDWAAHKASGRHGGGTDPFTTHMASYQGGTPAQAFHQQWAEAAYRVAKPSAYLLAFGGTRTVHRMTVALEDAGWIIRDMLVWAYASGFPKGRANLKPAWEPIVMARKPGPLRGLAIDACRIPTNGEEMSYSASAAQGVVMFGTGTVEQNPAGRWPANVILTDPIFDGGWEGVVGGGETSSGGRTFEPGAAKLGARGNSFTAGGTVCEPDSGTYSRFFMLSASRSGALSGIMGTCQTCGAPIAEPPSTARTPRPDIAPLSTDTPPFAQLDLDAFGAASPSPSPAIATAPSPAATPPDGTPDSTASEADQATGSGTSGIGTNTSPEPTPAIAFPSDQPARTAALPSASIDTTTTTVARSMCERCADDATHGRTLPQPKRTRPAPPADGDDYTRFLIVPKADRADREPVLGGLEPSRDLPLVGLGGKYCSLCGEAWINPDGWPRCGHGRDHTKRRPPVNPKPRGNSHPTVKPTDLMRHLVRLVTPPGGTVLDPFLGSGTTAIAAEMEGFPWIGIEREAEYIAIAEARLNGVQRGLGLETA